MNNLDNTREIYKEEAYNEIFNKGYEEYYSNILTKFHFNSTEFSNNENNIRTTCTFQEKHYKEKRWDIVNRCLEILKLSANVKIEDKISDLINWDLEPTKFYHITDSVLYSNESFSTNMCKEEICMLKVMDLEQKYDKNIGIQILNLDVKVSEKGKILPLKCDPGIMGLSLDLFFEIKHFAYKIVYL